MTKLTYKAIDNKIASYDESAKAAESIADPIIAKRTAQKAQHNSKQLTRVASLEGKEARKQALTLLNRAQRALSGNDAMKVASLSNVIQSNDIDKMNSGFYKALLGFDKLVNKHADKTDFSLTAIKQVVELKCNVKTSLTLLAKMTFLEQIKDGRAIVGYRINDREALNGLLNIFK